MTESRKALQSIEWAEVVVVVPEAARQQSPPAGPGDAGSRQTVLVVDDDARLRDLLCAVLVPLGCEVVAAGSGEEALTELLQRKVAVIVLDINMPGMNGFETAQLVRESEELASTPIIFLTGQAAEDSDLRRGYELGAVDFLVKPVSRQVLYGKVKALLELDRSFARLRCEAAELHEQQLHIARTAEIQQRQELAITRRRERLTNIFAEASIDLASLERAIVTELSQLFDAECVLRLSSPGHGWHDSVSHSGSAPESGGAYGRLEAWLVERLGDRNGSVSPYPDVMVEDLTARSRRVGVVCVGRAGGPPFSEADAALFRGASAAAALAVSNATLYRVQAEYAAVMQATGDAILAVDAAGEVRSCNKAASALFGGEYDGLLGRSIFDFAIESDRPRFRERLDFTLTAHQEVSLELTCQSKGDRQFDVTATLSPIGDSADLHVAVVIHDLTDIKEAQKEIRHLASHDPLTDLANRRQLGERLADIVLQYTETPGITALLYLDVNEFKHVNDTYGHDAGDELLLAVATRLRSAVDPQALVCRVGGDEFIVVLEHLPSVDSAAPEANRILNRLQAEPVHCRGVTIQPSLSMGASCLGSSARTAEELLSQADLAMFEAKKNRLDECVFYTDLIGSRHRQTASLQSEVADAIKRSEFRMVYQPIVNAATGALFGIEALVRWNVGGQEVPPDEIIDLAESSRQTSALGRWILRRSFEDFAHLGRKGMKLHVNISPNQVLRADFLNGLVDAYQDTRISPSHVCLELTERAFTESAAAAYATLNRARDIGFGLAIDDFGVEYASMTNLLHVPVDCLKIDRSFISQVHVNERVQRLVEGQIAVASSMRIKLVAEGVETREQADWLRQAGCLLHQGYLYARPTETSLLPEVLDRTAATLEALDDEAGTEVP